MINLKTPITEEDILKVKAGDVVLLSGTGVTSRDMAHKYMVETLIEGKEPLSPEDQRIYEELKKTLKDGFVYHSGPIVRQQDNQWKFISSGPTTSIRTEIYQHKVIKAFGVRVVIGKGGMGSLTLDACKKYRAIYLHGIGGAGVLNAEAVVDIIDVFKKEEFGLPEAIWKIHLENFTGIVTMDAYGNSIHEMISEEVKKNFEKLLLSGGNNI